MKRINTFLKVGVLCALILCACDLQPKIASIPDSIGIFIEDRYPALLADPTTQPEIYNSAVTDYGVYASPELYGSGNIDDYVLYASVDDYVLVPESEEEIKETEKSEPVILSDTATQVDTEEEIEQEIMTDYLIIPTYGGNTILDEKVEEKSEKIEEPVKQSEEKVQVEPAKEEKTKTTKNSDEIIVARGDTVYALARKNNMTIDEFAKINNLKEPYTLSVGQKLTTRASSVPVVVKKEVATPVPAVKKEVPNVISAEKVKEIKAEKAKVKSETKPEIKPNNTKRVDLTEIVVEKGDTLYSISRKYEIPVNDLAVMNKINAPFALSVGQKIKVPKLDTVQTRSATEIKTAKKAEQKQAAVSSKVDNKTQSKNTKPETKPTKQVDVPKKAENKQVKSEKTSQNTKKQSQKIAPRSNSKFSWPLRGTILSAYGPKKGGLVNDGINISASVGATVRAAENGVVAYAGNEVKGMGNLIIIQHSDGWMTIYAHLNSMDVRRGARVNVGDKIGSAGKTGKVDKPQLHFEIRKGTKSYNPTQYLKK